MNLLIFFLIISSCTKVSVSIHENKKELTDNLTIAIKRNNEELVIKLLNEGHDINARDGLGKSALMIAIEQNNIKIVNLLIKKGANFNFKTINGDTPLMQAILSKNEQIVSVLLKKELNVNERNYDGWTALMVASEIGYKRGLELLIEKGANVNYKDDIGYSPLMLATFYNHREVVEFLLEKGADINSKTNKGWDALGIAVSNSNKALAEILIEKGANINSKTNEGNTLLKIAFNRRCIEIINILLENIIEIEENDFLSIYILNGAFMNYIKEQNLNKVILMSYHYYNKININYRDEQENSYMHYAALTDNFYLIEMLLCKGCDINSLNIRGETPLYYALSMNIKNLQLIFHMIERGAVLYPSSYVSGKPLTDFLMPYQNLCNKLVYQPLTNKLLHNIKPNLKDEFIIKEIIRILRINEEDFINDKSMINYIKNFFKVRYNDINIFPSDLENILIDRESQNNLYHDGQISMVNDRNFEKELGYVYYPNKYLIENRYNVALKDILNKELILYKIRIMEEVVNKYKNNCRVKVIDEKGREIFKSREISNEYSNNYMTLELQDLLKVEGLYEKNSKEAYVPQFIVSEAKLLYGENVLEFITKTIISNKILKSEIEDYIKKVIFKNKSGDQVEELMSIEGFIYYKNNNLTREIIISLLLHFNLFSYN